MSKPTINEILNEAFDRIQREHRVSVESVRFSRVDASHPDGAEKHIVDGIEFEGRALSGGGEK